MRLLAARGSFDAARELAETIDAVAAKREMVRTRMRGLALAMALEHQAGEVSRATERLAGCLRLFNETGYARPLVREGRIALALLDGVEPLPEAVADAAARLRTAIAGETAAWATDTQLTDRELKVLALMDRYRDKEIAKLTDLTFYGVRYRIGNIFAKLGARGRLDAVHRAGSEGSCRRRRRGRRGRRDRALTPDALNGGGGSLGRQGFGWSGDGSRPRVRDGRGPQTAGFGKCEPTPRKAIFSR